MAFTAVFDAGALKPAAQRDLLLRLAQVGLFRGRWTIQILDEMERAIVEDHPDLAGGLSRTRDLMGEAVQDCLVEGYERLDCAVDLPNPGTGHVLAAAIRCGAQVIVTERLEDYPSASLSEFGIEAQTADEFLLYVVDLWPEEVETALKRQASAPNPSHSIGDLLETLNRSGLRRTVEHIRTQLGP